MQHRKKYIPLLCLLCVVVFVSVFVFHFSSYCVPVMCRVRVVLRFALYFFASPTWIERHKKYLNWNGLSSVTPGVNRCLHFARNGCRHCIIVDKNGCRHCCQSTGVGREQLCICSIMFSNVETKAAFRIFSRLVYHAHFSNVSSLRFNKTSVVDGRRPMAPPVSQSQLQYI